MAFLNKIMIHLNNASRSALEPVNNTLESKLYTFLKKMLEAGSDGKMVCEEIRALNEDVVYFVLNGTDLRNNERSFVAGLNWFKLDNKLKTKSFADLSAANSSNAVTLLYSTKKEVLTTRPEDAKYINGCWNMVWDDYLILTKEEESLNNRFTLNHGLLNYTKFPLHTGIYWGEPSKDTDVDGGYFYLPETTLLKLGAEKVLEAGFNPYSLPREYNRKITDDSPLSQIETHMSDMDPDVPELNNLDNIGFAVYHIIRSYGCWGGTAFYSIPINFGSSSEKRIAILSICTKKPLSEKLIERWSLVANKAFKDIILHEIDTFKEMERKSDFIAATYSLGHNLKNRVLDSDRKIEELRQEVRNELDKYNAGTGKIDPKYILEQISNIGLQVKSLSNTGNLLDLIARAMTEKFDTLFALKPDWYSTEEFGLREFIKNFFVNKFYVVSKLGNYGKISIKNLPATIKIIPWFYCKEENKTIRPADFVYEEIFFELFVNALSYGDSYADRGKNRVDIEVEGSENKIIISNTPAKAAHENKLFQDDDKVDREIPAEIVGHGGLLYINNFLRLTKTGSLSVILDRKGNKFKVILYLDGLAIKTPEHDPKTTSIAY